MGGECSKTHCIKSMTKSTGWSTGGAKGSQHWLHYNIFPEDSPFKNYETN